MFVVMIASECAPVAQAGGLGEVVFGLSRELELRGHAVEIILPKYDCLRYDQIFGLTVAYPDLWVPWYDGFVHCTVWFGFVHGRRCFFLEPHSPDRFFSRGHLYGSADDVTRFAFLSKAALEFMWKSGKRPEVIHCHDWQTGLVPVLLYEIYQHLGMRDQRVCYTIHNFAHQGISGEYILWATGLTRPAHFFDYSRLRDNFNHGAINLMKGGIVYSNFVTTVSPQHAWEATYADQGMGLRHTLHIHREKFGGVLNGMPGGLRAGVPADLQASSKSARTTGPGSPSCMSLRVPNRAPRRGGDGRASMRWPERIKGRPWTALPGRCAASRRLPAGTARQSGGGSDQVQGNEGQGPRHVHRRSPGGRPDRGGVRGVERLVGRRWCDAPRYRGGLQPDARLDTGRAYRFRYLLHGRRWDNDWAADAYVRNDFGGDDSVVDLTVLAGPVPPAASRTPGKKEAAKKAAPARTAQKAAAPAAKPAKGRAR